MSPREVDDCEIWEIGAVLGRNEAEQREPWPEDAPHIRVMRRNHALSNGLPVPAADVPVGDDEYRMLLAMVKSGTRKAVGR